MSQKKTSSTRASAPPADFLLPGMVSEVEAEVRLPRVDLSIEGDGIDDRTHEARAFLTDMGTGRDGLLPPVPGQDKTWPPLPEDVQGIDQRFFRKPDFVTDGVDSDTYLEQFLSKARELGWVHRRGPLVQLGRYLGGVFVAATGVGIPYLLYQHTWIHPGHIGFCADLNEKVRLLLPGHHCEYNPAQSPIVTFHVTKDYIAFLKRAHIVRVHPGQYVVCKVNDQYQLLAPGDNHAVGVHVFDDPQFELVSRVKQTNPAILAGPINIITVPPGQVARIMIQNRPYLLFEGQHRITSGLLEFGDRILSNEDREEQKHHAASGIQPQNKATVGFSNLKDSFLYHLIGKVYVKPGEVVGVQVNRRAVFLDQPGDYYFYSDQIELSPAVSRVTPRVAFSSLMRVYIKENEYGIVQRANGSLEILGNGCHVIEVPNKFLVSLPKTIQYREITNIKGITQDPMDVVFNFTLAYRITQPFKAFMLGSQRQIEDGKKAESDLDIFKQIDDTIIRTCTRTVQDIVRQLVFKDTLMLHRVAREELKDHNDDAEGLPPGSLKSQFKQISQGNVKITLRTLSEVFGVELLVEEFGISKLDLANPIEQAELNKAAFESAKAKAALVVAENNKKLELYNKDIVEIKARTAVAQQLITAESTGQIAALNARARAEESKILVDAKVYETEAMGDVHAKQIVKQASAEAQAIRQKGEAEGYASQQYQDRTQVQLMGHLATMFQGMHLNVVDSQQGAFGQIMSVLVKTLGEAAVPPLVPK